MPNVNQKAPKEPKTTKGKVLPMTHCERLVLMPEDEEVGLADTAKFTYFSDRAEHHEDTTE
jgi:hypothetical protein